MWHLLQGPWTFDVWWTILPAMQLLPSLLPMCLGLQFLLTSASNGTACQCLISRDGGHREVTRQTWCDCPLGSFQLIPPSTPYKATGNFLLGYFFLSHRLLTSSLRCTKMNEYSDFRWQIWKWKLPEKSPEITQDGCQEAKTDKLQFQFSVGVRTGENLLDSGNNFPAQRIRWSEVKVLTS